MNGETRFGMLVQQTLWNCTRERFRASRKDVFIVCQQSAARVVTRFKGKTILVAPGPAMDRVVFYDGAAAAAEVAESMEKRVDGLDLVAVPAYEYAKAREYSCRNELANATGASHG